MLIKPMSAGDTNSHIKHTSMSSLRYLQLHPTQLLHPILPDRGHIGGCLRTWPTQQNRHHRTLPGDSEPKGCKVKFVCDCPPEARQKLPVLGGLRPEERAVLEAWGPEHAQPVTSPFVVSTKFLWFCPFTVTWVTWVS